MILELTHSLLLDSQYCENERISRCAGSFRHDTISTPARGGQDPSKRDPSIKSGVVHLNLPKMPW